MASNRVIIHADFDYFYAQCEERENPTLKDKPVVVCIYSGRSEDSGAVSTANYIARKYGVKAGISIVMAKRKLKNTDAVFLPANFELYEKVSESIMNTLRTYGDAFEQTGIDEAFMDVTQRVNGDFEIAKQLAQKIQKEIFEKEKITVSIGVGPNKLIAKIAAGKRKPHGLTVVTPEEIENFLAPLPVNELIGVGKKTAAVMEEMGIKTISDLANYDLEKLVKKFGKLLGVYFHNAALGIDESPVKERGTVESISRIVTLKDDTRDLDKILENAYEICIDIQARANRANLSFKSVTIYVVLQDMHSHSRSKTFEAPVDSLEMLKEATKELFQRLLHDTPEELKVRRIGVKISNFIHGKQSQKQLTEFVKES
ncbi:MAG: DNA polymerase IV [Candidatus Bathyarchaeia archaeon]